jgi:hypothetical protein
VKGMLLLISKSFQSCGLWVRVPLITTGSGIIIFELLKTWFKFIGVNYLCNMNELTLITDPEFMKMPLVFLELELDQFVILSDSEIELLLQSYYNSN